VNKINTNSEELEKIIFEFIKNRTNQKESTTSRHIHRRFDIDMEKAEQILTDLSEKKLIEEFYDEEYQENRYTLKK
jgi:predicted transcriptional regulator